MIRKSPKGFAAFVLVLALACHAPVFGASAQPAISRPSPYLFEASTVVRVACMTKDGPTWGSAFYLGSGLFMTADHVIEQSVCAIDGHPITVEFKSATPDYAVIRAAYFPPYYVNYSCDRLASGKPYIAAGYAGTDRDAVAQTLLVSTGVDDADDKTTEVNGSLVQGMSGGPVLDMVGAVHAINTWQQAEGAPAGGVTEIADTLLCKEGRRL